MDYRSANTRSSHLSKSYCVLGIVLNMLRIFIPLFSQLYEVNQGTRY